MHENQITVVIKEVGKEPEVEYFFDNTLKAFQEAVGGYIETAKLAKNLVLIVNEEGILQGLPYNTTVCGHPFFGTILAVATKGDEFVSISGKNLPLVTELLTKQSDALYARAEELYNKAQECNERYLELLKPYKYVKDIPVRVLGQLKQIVQKRDYYINESRVMADKAERLWNDD